MCWYVNELFILCEHSPQSCSFFASLHASAEIGLDNALWLPLILLSLRLAGKLHVFVAHIIEVGFLLLRVANHLLRLFDRRLHRVLHAICRLQCQVHFLRYLIVVGK